MKDGSKLTLMSGTTVTKAFVPLPGGATGVYSGSTLGWYRHPDWLGSSRIASTPGRTVSYDGTASYSPFGESPTETGDHNFTGQNQDLVPNFLYDFPAREYHPGEGRWLSPDPAGMAAADPTNPQSWNRYAYVGNSPLDNVDPSGMYIPNNSYVATGTLVYWSNGCMYMRPMTVIGTLPDGQDGTWVVLGDPVELICASQTPGTDSNPIWMGQTAPGQTGGQAGYQSSATKTCFGFARGLEGNTGLIGKIGAFPGVPVQNNTAAIVTGQFGMTKAQLSPYLGNIRGQVGSAFFSGVTDRIDNKAMPRGCPANISVGECFQRLNPGRLIIEIVGASDQGLNAPAAIQEPQQVACPAGTTQVP